MGKIEIIKINIDKIVKNKWVKIGSGNIQFELCDDEGDIDIKFITSCVPTTPPFEIYKSKDFEYHREYDWLDDKTSIRILKK